MADAGVDESQEEVVDTSVNEAEDQAALETRIDEELAKDGISVPKPKEEVKDDNKSEDTTGDDGESTGSDDDAESEDASEGESEDESAGDSAVDSSTTELASDPDFSFEVEDINGAKFKITKIEDLPEDFEPKNNRQVMEIIAEANKLEGQIANHVAEEAQKEEAAILASAQAGIQKGWESDIQELVDEKLLDKPKLAENNPKYNEDPAVKKIDEVFKYIKETNDARKAAGNPNLLTSFRDAYERMELRDFKTKQAEEAKKEGALAKTKAGVIGTTSTASVDVPVYRAGSYRTMDDIPL